MSPRRVGPVAVPRREATDDLAWRAQGACAKAPDPDAFVVGTPTGRASELAEQFCARCPVAQRCEKHARATRSQGVWGGWHFPAPGFGRPINLLGPPR